MITPAFLPPYDRLLTESLDRNRVRLLTPLVYRSAVLRAQLTVPAGFVTDGESIPRWLPLAYSILKGRAPRAGVVHDWCYQTHLMGRAAEWPNPQRVADAILREACRCEPECPTWAQLVIHAGVRVGGAGAWASGPRRLVILGNEALA